MRRIGFRVLALTLVVAGSLAAGCGDVDPVGGGEQTAPPSLPLPAPVDTSVPVVVPPQEGPDSMAVDTTAPSDVARDVALDSLRAEVGRLSALVAASLEVAAAPVQPEATDAAADTTALDLREAGRQARNYGLRALWAVVFLVLTSMIVRLAVGVLDRVAERSAERRLFVKRLVPIVRIVGWALAFYLVIRVILDVDAQGVLAAAAAVGVAVGFAAQDILKNIFGGLVIVFDQPFQVGDKVSVGGTYGEVMSIGLRSTRIRTADDNLVTVPNATIAEGQVANANAGALDCMVVTDLYLPGWADEAQARRIAYQVAASSRYVHLARPIVIRTSDEVHDTFLTHLKVKAYVMDNRYEFAFSSDVTERARAEFRRQGLIPPWHGAVEWVRRDEAGRGAAGEEGGEVPAPHPLTAEGASS